MDKPGPSSLVEGTTLNVPFPTDSTSLNGPLPGLSTAGAVLVEVYNQTRPSSYLIVGSTTLTVNDMRPCALRVRSVTLNSIDMFASPLPSPSPAADSPIRASACR